MNSKRRGSPTLRSTPNDVLLNITAASVARCCLAPPEFLPAVSINMYPSSDPSRRSLPQPSCITYSSRRPIRIAFCTRGEEGGSTRQAITKLQIQEFLVQLPESLSEQQRILGILDEAFDGIVR